MWAFRQRRQDLSQEQTQGLDELFQRIPELETVYERRWGITEIFDEATDREDAASRLGQFRESLEEDDALQEFFRTTNIVMASWRISMSERQAAW